MGARDLRRGAGPLTIGDAELHVDRAGSQLRLAIKGDIDEDTYADLHAALSSIADGSGEIHVDLADMQFCDLAGLRAIIRLSEDCPGHNGHGRRVVILHQLPPELKTLLHILGWDAAPGLRIDESPPCPQL